MPYTIDFSEYCTYDALTAHLRGLADAYPTLARLSSIGQSHRGRELWLMTLTNPATGRDFDKPAFYIDAHIHAEEVMTSQTALYTIWYLLTQYGADAEVTWLLDHLVFYILPRTNPDGAEISLTTPHHWCGNGRYLPGEEQTRGLVQKDINGDGLIVQMRIEDPAGEWRISDKDPRLMVLRQPGEINTGPYYRLFREGEIRGAQGGAVNIGSIEIERPRDGNLNRNFPAGWRPEFRQYGAGDYPLSEPESRAVAEFILSHKNIAGMQCYHTHGGVHLRPSLVAPDSSLPPNDLALYKVIGAMGTALTGYPVISVYEEFTTEPDKPRVGSLMQWSYDEMGIITFSTELWNPELAAGIAEPAKYQLRARSEEDEIALLRYNDEHLGGAGFVNWTPFDHPQLGRVEIGGWTHMYTFRNPPPGSMAKTERAKRFIIDTAHANCLFTLKHAACSPLLRITSLKAEPLGNSLHKITAVVANQGFLPTYTSEIALKHGTAGPVHVSLTRTISDSESDTDPLEILIGSADQQIGHLAGRDERVATWSPWMRDWNVTTKTVEWLVRARTTTQITVTAQADRAGAQRKTVQLTNVENVELEV